VLSMDCKLPLSSLSSLRKTLELNGYLRRYMVRQSEIEQNSWASLVDDTESWGWDQVYPYLKKSENWTAPSESHIEQAQVVLDPSLHGTEGPVHYSYPGYWYDSQYEWIPTLANMGVESRDPAGGEGWGAFFATSAINPSNVSSLSFLRRLAELILVPPL
jgi:choline dehydrogenase